MVKIILKLALRLLDLFFKLKADDEEKKKLIKESFEISQKHALSSVKLNRSEKKQIKDLGRKWNEITKGKKSP